MDILNHHCFYKCDAFTLEGWHTDRNDEHIVTLQLTPKSFKYDFNFKCLTRCACGHCAWRRANAKAKAFLKAIGINKIHEVKE